MGVGWGSYFVAHNGYYPVAVVNWRVITAREWQKAFGPAMIYYKNLKKPEVSEQLFQKEISRAVLDKLIEHELIIKTLAVEDVEARIEALVQKNKNLKEGAELLYQLPWTSVKDLILKPQAALELMEQNLKDKNQNLTDWLKDRKTKAKVYIFAKGFLWNGEQVIAQ